MNQGLVVAGHGRHYLVEASDGRRLICRPRGKKSDCVVGDQVDWEATNAASDEGLIQAVRPRKNLLFRRDLWRTKAFAANLDQVLVMVASEPVFSESQLARALIAAEHAGIPARLILNKAELPAVAAARERLAPYQAMGYDLIEVSLKAEPAQALARLRSELQGRASLVLGPSGVGKSTLINLLLPEARVEVGEISEALNSGRHTTTHTQWHWLSDDFGGAASTSTHKPAPSARGALIDSPGFQEFGLHQIEAASLPTLMPDLRAHIPQCRFYNCTHQHEPGCGVLAAVERGEIAPSRMRIYAEVLQELAQTRW
jgi:ribosome biogenesis GTPase